jgi:hypothetical protein
MAYTTLVRRREGPRRAKISMTIAPQLDKAIRDAAAERGVALSWLIEDTLAAALLPMPCR